MESRNRSSLDVAPPKAVAFDCFGTLIGIANRLDPYQRLAADLDRGSARRSFMTQDLPIGDLAIGLGRESLAAELSRTLQAELNSLFVYPDAIEVLEALRHHGVSVALCSNLAAGYGGAVRRLLPQVNAFVFSYEVGAIKPEPAIYAEVCRHLNVAPNDVLFIGDSPRCDLQGPSAYGMRSQLLSRASGQTLLGLLSTLGLRGRHFEASAPASAE
ncbi:MAG: HAD family hydrolase [Burkholderiaceae bacterium]